MKPLLSICIPTYNRASRLKVMLEAVLPQVAAHQERVELWVSDNASPDGTAQVVEAARQFGPLNYSRNDSNLGAIRNVVRLATQLAQGEFIWMMGDDDLLAPDALGRVLATLADHSDLDAFYLNFACNNVDSWPATALNGFIGLASNPANSDLSSHSVSEWQELVTPESSLCTQLYAHVLRRGIWLDYWRNRTVGEPYTAARWTYPHTFMIAETMMGKPCYYVGKPVLTIFDGAESWSDQKPLVVLIRYPELLRFYRQLGLHGDSARYCERGVYQSCDGLLSALLEGKLPASSPGVLAYLRANGRSLEAWKALARAMYRTRKPLWVNVLMSPAIAAYKLTKALRRMLRPARAVDT